MCEMIKFFLMKSHDPSIDNHRQQTHTFHYIVCVL
jgi:hypothetical protein